jgi:hypothetical protein
MKRFSVVILFCMLLLALGVYAEQTSVQQPAQTPQLPAAANQTPQQPGTVPDEATSQQPGSMQNPQPQPSQATPVRPSGSDIDEQVNALSNALNLTSDQQGKLKTILEDQHQQAVAVVSDNTLSRDAKMQKVHGLRESTITRVRSILTSQEQKNKFDAMVQAQNQRIQEREQQQQQNNNPLPK